MILTRAEIKRRALTDPSKLADLVVDLLAERDSRIEKLESLNRELQTKNKERNQTCLEYAAKVRKLENEFNWLHKKIAIPMKVVNRLEHLERIRGAAKDFYKHTTDLQLNNYQEDFRMWLGRELSAYRQEKSDE